MSEGPAEALYDWSFLKRVSIVECAGFPPYLGLPSVFGTGLVIVAGVGLLDYFKWCTCGAGWR